MKLKELRALKGLSQTDLAKITKVKQSTISAIEAGTSEGFSPKTMKALADALEVTVFDVAEFSAKIRDDNGSEGTGADAPYYPEPDELREIQAAIRESEAEKSRDFRLTHEQVTDRVAARIANYRMQKERAST